MSSTIPARTIRLHFIDNWRSAIIILVVLHHVALAYGFTLIQSFLKYSAKPLVNQSP